MVQQFRIQMVRIHHPTIFSALMDILNLQTPRFSYIKQRLLRLLKSTPVALQDHAVAQMFTRIRTCLKYFNLLQDLRSSKRL